MYNVCEGQYACTHAGVQHTYHVHVVYCHDLLAILFCVSNAVHKCAFTCTSCTVKPLPHCPCGHQRIEPNRTSTVSPPPLPHLALHTRARACAHTHVHAHTRACIHTYMYADICMHTVYSWEHVHNPDQHCMRTHTCGHEHSRTHTHTHTHTYTHVRTHTHTHTPAHR